MFSLIDVHTGELYTGIKYYIADYVSDVATLPTSTAKGTSGDNIVINARCRAGSTCRVAEDSSLWILNNQDVWVQQSSNGSGDSGESTTYAVVADDNDISAICGEVFS